MTDQWITVENCRHYWKNKENATWELTTNFPDEVFRHFKSQYSKLEMNQPESEVWEGYQIHYQYHEDVDKYDRRIIEISAEVEAKPEVSFKQKILNFFRR